MRPFLLGFSVLATLLFGVAFALSFTDAPLVERAGREMVRIEVEHRVGQQIDSLSNFYIASQAQRLLRKTDSEIASAREAVRKDIPVKVAQVIANMLNADCECRKRMAAYAQWSENQRFSSLTQVRDKLVALIESSYASVADNLLREFRIFTASNAIAFTLLALIIRFRGQSTLQLVVPAVILLAAVGTTGGLYLFNQNWLHTIVFGQYVGMAYAAYLAAVAIFFADIFLNKARLTTKALNVILQLFGSVAVAPC
jgi:hypothetical protein